VLSMAIHRSHQAQKLCLHYRLVRLRKRVTTRDEIIFAVFADHAMHKQALAASIGNYRAWLDFTEVNRFKFEIIAGPDARQHAAALRADTRAAEVAQKVCGQLYRNSVLCFGGHRL